MLFHALMCFLVTVGLRETAMVTHLRLNWIWTSSTFLTIRLVKRPGKRVLWLNGVQHNVPINQKHVGINPPKVTYNFERISNIRGKLAITNFSLISLLKRHQTHFFKVG